MRTHLSVGRIAAVQRDLVAPVDERRQRHDVVPVGRHRRLLVSVQGHLLHGARSVQTTLHVGAEHARMRNEQQRAMT